ncbi:MAG: helix-turn-helix domain-containing protein, partial [Alphaproteobacteria bacterium]|nr:helix-turn-helix domain-containing protein [Alphaproteobacteria bacterium]
MDDEGGLNRRRIHLREISGDLDAPLETVGQDLRAARLRRGDDLATVSRVLKIRKDHLEALEEDRIEALPGRTYAVGFVR